MPASLDPPTDAPTGGGSASAQGSGPTPRRWYVVHTYSGYEAKVKASLDERRRADLAKKKSDLQALEIKPTKGEKELAAIVDLEKAISQLESFREVLVPVEKVVELVKGQRRTSTRKFFPGYILVNIDQLGDYIKGFIKATPRVTGFVGGTDDPPPISEADVRDITQHMTEGTTKPKVLFEAGENVKVVDGPFQDFNGVVEEVKPDKGKLRVLISIFGRATPVELEFVQVEKA